jgi:hypothetical protein
MADNLVLPDPAADFEMSGVAGQVGVDGLKSGRMSDAHHAAEGASPAERDYHSGRCGTDRCAGWGGDVEASVIGSATPPSDAGATQSRT